MSGGGSSGSNLAFIGVGATRQIMLRGASVNTQFHQALSLNGANIGGRGPGSARRAFRSNSKCPIACKFILCKSPCDKMYVYN